MKKRTFKFISGVFLLLVGVFLIFNSFSGITGFVIFENTKNVRGLLGLVFIVVGAVLFITRGEEEKRYRVEAIIRDYESRKLGPVETAARINHLYTISGVKFKPGSTNSVVSPDGIHPLRLKHGRLARDLALGIYEMALGNDPRNRKNCELHLAKDASTKHHKEGFEREVGKFERRHEKELTDAFGAS